MRYGLALALLTLIACSSGSKDVTEPAQDQFFAQAGDLAASHILIAYQGAERVDPSVTRTREEALELADQLQQQLAANPAGFEDMAATHSDGPSKTNAGYLGPWRLGSMAGPFESAVKRIEIGELTSAPVETVFGFHLIRRESMQVRFLGGDGFLVAHKETPRPIPGVNRSLDEARALAEEIGGKLNNDNFDALATEYNDRGDGPIFLGAFSARDVVYKDIIDTLSQLDFNAVGGPIETPIGFTYVRRKRLEQRNGSHILISHRDARNATGMIIRSREEALARANEVLALVQAGERSFNDIAREFSDDPSASHGGGLFPWFRGTMMPEFEAAVDQLTIDGVSTEPLETPFGFHIIRREALPGDSSR